MFKRSVCTKKWQKNNMRYLVFALSLLTGSAYAEELISPSQFQSMTEGKTLYFNREGTAYGAEQYLPGRRVIWTFFDGTCQEGTWYAARDEICFLYDGRDTAQCWYFLETDSGKRARIVGDNPRNDLSVVGETDEPLQCPGPSVGASFIPSS